MTGLCTKSLLGYNDCLKILNSNFNIYHLEQKLYIASIHLLLQKLPSFLPSSSALYISCLEFYNFQASPETNLRYYFEGEPQMETLVISLTYIIPLIDHGGETLGADQKAI